MITSFELKFGGSTNDIPLKINDPAVTVFVGPNNSGKSLILREILSACNGADGSHNKILNNIVFEIFTKEQALKELEKINSEPRNSENIPITNKFIEINGIRVGIVINDYISARTDPNSSPYKSQKFGGMVARLYTLNMDGPNRMSLVNTRPRGDLKYPNNSLSRIITDNKRRESLRTILYDAFGFHLGIDISVGDQIEIRFGSTPPPNERSVEDRTLKWMRKAKPISEMSDGIKAFTGILLELRAGDPKIIIIDEPEAFLHPSLAFKLGREIALTTTESGKHVFVSTHSPQFLMGAVQSGANINIIRLTYKSGTGTARLLSNEDLSTMMQDPMLRSTNAMEGLFYENVIVTEADADRAFYQEINYRLADNNTKRGIPNALFLNANGKDTVHRIVAPLRRLGIPTAAILDIDALREGGASWTNHLKACAIPTLQHQPKGTERSHVWKSLTKNGRKPKIEGGLNLLTGQDREAAENLIKSLNDYGLFILPIGEVERWLPQLKVSRSKQGWLRAIFVEMGRDPQSPNYILPCDDDVWNFVSIVGKWLTNPNRRGIPLC